MTSSEFEFVEPIFRRVRHVTNYAHDEINGADSSIPELPIPDFTGNDGFWNTNGSNQEYSNGFIDFGKKKCTNGKNDWDVRYLLGESEWKTDEYHTLKPPDFGRKRWDMDHCERNNDKFGGPGHNMQNFWITRGDPSGPVVLIDRTKSNVSNRFAYGYCDCEPLFSNPTQIDPYSSNKAHYIRAKGITFRYKIDFNEDAQVGEEQTHGITPLRSMGLFFMKPNLGNSTDRKLYYAELLMESNETVRGQQGYLGYKGVLDLANRAGARRQYHNIHWKNDWTILYNDTVKDPDTGEDKNVLKQISGGGPWDEHGFRSHNEEYVSKSLTRTNKFPTSGGVTGCATLMLSEKAVKHIWKNDMVCVGFAAVGSHSNGAGIWTVGSSGSFRVYDLKLLEMEHSADNEMVFPPKDSIETQYFSNVMRAPKTPKDAGQFNSLSRQAPRYDLSVDLDLS